MIPAILGIAQVAQVAQVACEVLWVLVPIQYTRKGITVTIVTNS